MVEVTAKNWQQWLSLSVVATLLAVLSIPALAQQEGKVTENDTTALELPLPSDSSSGQDSLPVELLSDPDKQSTTPATVNFDSSEVSAISIPDETLKDFRNDSDFDYSTNNPGQEDSWWGRFKRWIAEMLLDSLGGASSLVSTLLWIALGLVLIFTIISITGVRKMFGSAGKSLVSGIEELGEDIHAMDFNRLIDEAVAAGDYRRAIRLHYLKNLKQLTDRNFIDWRIDKTNYEYLTELRDKPIAQPFREATVAFEYAWYGDVKLTKPLFERLRQRFKKLGDMVGEKN